MSDKLPIWRYDEQSRTVYNSADGEAICIVSDLPTVDQMHKNGRMLAAAPNLLHHLRAMVRGDHIVTLKLLERFIADAEDAE